MPVGALVSSVRSYTSATKKMPYSESMFAKALADTSKFKFSKFGEYTAVRNLIGETSGSYNKGQGFNANFLTPEVWEEFRAEYDREISFSVDVQDELNSILSGMELTGLGVLRQSWKRLGPEIDATSASTIWNKIATINKKSNLDVGYKTDIDNIVQTLINLDNELYDLGYYGDVAVMMSTKVAGYLSQAIVKFNGLASGAMLTAASAREVKRSVNFRGQDYDEKGLAFTYDVIKFQSRLYIYKVPSQCMVSNVILLDKQSDGQEAGGWIPDVDNTSFKNIDILVVPTDAAAVSIRHIVGSMTIPLGVYNIDRFNVEEELTGLNNMYDGQCYIENIGIDQTADRFKYMNRVKYGAIVFSALAHTITGIYSEDTSGESTVESLMLSVPELPKTGGTTILTVSGTGFTSAIAQVYKEDGITSVGQPITLTGNDKLRVGLISLSDNTGNDDVNYVIKVSVDGGATWETKTITATVKAVV